MTSKAQFKNTKIISLEFIKIKNFALQDTTKKIKNQVIDWERYSQYFYLTKDLY